MKNVLICYALAYVLGCVASKAVILLCKRVKISLRQNALNGFLLFFPTYWFMTEAPWYYAGGFGRLLGVFIHLIIFLLSAGLFFEVLMSSKLSKYCKITFLLMLCALTGMHIREGDFISLCSLFFVGAAVMAKFSLFCSRAYSFVFTVLSVSILLLLSAATAEMQQISALLSSSLMSIFAGLAAAFVLKEKEKNFNALFGFSLAFFVCYCF